jgi:hypothetical protein
MISPEPIEMPKSPECTTSLPHSQALSASEDQGDPPQAKAQPEGYV